MEADEAGDNAEMREALGVGPNVGSILREGLGLPLVTLPSSSSSAVVSIICGDSAAKETKRAGLTAAFASFSSLLGVAAFAAATAAAAAAAAADSGSEVNERDRLIGASFA